MTTTTFRPVSALLGVRIAGAPLPADVEPLLLRSYVDDHLGKPDTFVLEFDDPAHNVLTRAHATVGAEVTLSAVTEDEPSGVELLVGEVTAVEFEFDPTGSRTLVRGYDRSHRLFRGRATRAWTNATHADVVRDIAEQAGVTPGDVASTPTVLDHVVQPNVSDWEALTMLASEIGFEVAVRRGRLDFREPPSAQSSGPPGDGPAADPLRLTAGTNLLRFRAVLTSAEQVSELRVRSWDYKQKQPVEGSAPAKTSMASLGTTPAELGEHFGSQVLTAVTTPFGTKAEVDVAAKALAERAASRFATVEGVAVGSPKLRAGAVVTIAAVGEPFEGTCVLTTTRHRFDAEEGYTTAFTVTAGQEDSLLGLGEGGGGAASAHFDGVVPAVVTDVRDPDDLGRVKVSFPWLSDTYVSDWSRVAQTGAGSGRGGVVLPEVDDEVLVAFEHGDMRRAYVVGGLYNGVDKPALGDGLVDGSSGAVTRRGFVSKKGSALVFLDGDGKEGIALLSADKALRLALNSSATTIRVASDGSVEIEGKDVSVKATSSVSIESEASMSLKAGTSLELHGSQVKVGADGPVQVSGSPIQLN